jgi:hypothetical protein
MHTIYEPLVLLVALVAILPITRVHVRIPLLVKALLTYVASWRLGRQVRAFRNVGLL